MPDATGVLPGPTVDVTTGLGDVRRLQEFCESLSGLPVTSRWPWLSASVTSLSREADVSVVEVAESGELTALALLLNDRSGPVVRTTLAGSAEEHRGALLAVGDRAAARLGAAVARELMSGARQFSIGPVRPGPAVDALIENLPLAVVVDKVDVPVVRANPDTPPGMSRGMTRTLRKAANRLAADGLTADVAMTSDGAAISALVPLLESISRDRDHAAGRPSPLDDLKRRRLWQRRVVGMAAAGMLRLATLRIANELAAYVLGIDDGSTYSILEGRYVGQWARYAPGRVLEAAVLEPVVGSADLTTLDWMTAIAPETLLASNDVESLVVVGGRT